MARQKKSTLDRIVAAVDGAVQAVGLTLEPASREPENEPKSVRKARQKACIERIEQAQEIAELTRRASRPTRKQVRSQPS